MDEPSAQTRVHLADTYRRVIKDIENLEQFYEAKVLAISSGNKPETTSVHFGSKPVPLDSKGRKLHPRGPDGSRLDDESESSNGSYLYYETLDTLLPETPREYDVRMRGMWGNPPSVHGNDNYPSSVLNKDGYL